MGFEKLMMRETAGSAVFGVGLADAKRQSALEILLPKLLTGLYLDR